jgi:hypothetical protein
MTDAKTCINHRDRPGTWVMADGTDVCDECHDSLWYGAQRITLDQAQRLLAQEPQLGETIDRVRQRLTEAEWLMARTRMTMLRAETERQESTVAADRPQWPERHDLLVALVSPDGRFRRTFPQQIPPPVHGDLVDLPSGQYRVIRRRWDLSQPGLIGLEVVADDQPE